MCQCYHSLYTRNPELLPGLMTICPQSLKKKSVNVTYDALYHRGMPRLGTQMRI